MSSKTTVPKPTLAGTQNKQRKREVISKAKFDPTTFRNSFLTETKKIDNLEAYAAYLQLPAVVDKLDYKKYGDVFFELLITGFLLAPGGTPIDDRAERNDFSIFAAESDDVKNRVEVINKIVRRYKYLQRNLEATLVQLLQYVNKFSPEDCDKLAETLGILLGLGHVAIPILNNLLKDHLVKDSISLEFVTKVFQSLINEQGIDSLLTSLKRAGFENALIEFFPNSMRNINSIESHFSKFDNMKGIVDFYKNFLQNSLRVEVKSLLKSLFEDEASNDEIIKFAKEQQKSNSLSEFDVLLLTWNALFESIDWGTKPEQVESQLTKSILTWGKVFEPFVTTAKSEIGFLVHIQTHFYEDAKFMRLFSKTVQSLYKLDVLSDQAIIYWFEKGASNSGKSNFLKQTELFVSWLKAQEDEESEEDE